VEYQTRNGRQSPRNSAFGQRIREDGLATDASGAVFRRRSTLLLPLRKRDPLSPDMGVSRGPDAMRKRTEPPLRLGPSGQRSLLYSVGAGQAPRVSGSARIPRLRVSQALKPSIIEVRIGCAFRRFDARDRQHPSVRRMNASGPIVIPPGQVVVYTVLLGGRSFGMYRHWQPVLSTYMAPLTTSRTTTSRLRPPRLAGGISGSTSQMTPQIESHTIRAVQAPSAGNMSSTTG
jgi:hypothetical protein